MAAASSDATAAYRGDEQAPVADRLHAIARRVLDARKDEYDPWLYRYCGELADPDDVRRYLRYQLDHLALGGIEPQDDRILDVGCGFGMTLVVMGLLGAERLDGIDNYPAMIDTIEAYKPLLPDDLASRLCVVKGDAAEMPYDDGEFDVLLSIEAISHYLDVDGFLREASRVLRPGGTMIVSDGNNGSNPIIRRKTHAIWHAFEGGPDGTEVHGHTVGTSYRTRRRAILAEAVDGLPPKQADVLAERTAGMIESEVIEAGRRFVEEGALPEPALRDDDVPVSPDGQVIERLFAPYELARQIDSFGFRSRVHGYWGGAQGSPLLRGANSVLDRLSPATIYTARSFRIVSVREP